MTKMQMITRYSNFITGKEIDSWDQRLTALCEQKRVTTGAAFYVYHSNSWWPVKKMDELYNNARSANDYLKSIKSKPKRFYEQIWVELQQKYEEMQVFILEQESLPFEKTQMQLLKASGELIKE